MTGYWWGCGLKSNVLPPTLLCLALLPIHLYSIRSLISTMWFFMLAILPFSCVIGEFGFRSVLLIPFALNYDPLTAPPPLYLIFDESRYNYLELAHFHIHLHFCGMWGVNPLGLGYLIGRWFLTSPRLRIWDLNEVKVRLTLHFRLSRFSVKPSVTFRYHLPTIQYSNNECRFALCVRGVSGVKRRYKL
jgi:hypothetical protein